MLLKVKNADGIWEEVPILQGEKGEKGDTGAKGDKGDKGDTGEQGPIGPLNPNSVLFTPQSLTTAQKEQARLNIGVTGGADTPSGDPLHEYYLADGFLYNNTSEAIQRQVPWHDLYDTTEEGYVSHLPGHWYYNGIGDLTNKQVENIYITTHNLWRTNNSYGLYEGINVRTIISPDHLGYNRFKDFRYTYYRIGALLETVYCPPEFGFSLTGTMYIYTCDNATLMMSRHPNLKALVIPFNVQNMIDPSRWNGFLNENFPNNKILIITNARCNLPIWNMPKLSKKCLLHLINNAHSNSNFIVTLHAEAYNRFYNDPDVMAAIDNVKLNKSVTLQLASR